MPETARHLARLRDLYAMLSRTNEAIIRATDPVALYREICRVVVDEGQFLVAWVGLLEEGEIVPVAHAGASGDFILQQRFPFEPPPAASPAPTFTAGQVHILNRPEETSLPPAWRSLFLRLGIGSAALLPLKRGGTEFGLLCVCSGEPRYFDAELTALLEQMAADIAFALDGFDREQARQLAEASLADSERRYRELFEHMASGVAVYQASDDGRDFLFRDVNAALERIEDVHREDLIGRRLTEVFPGVEEFGLLAVLERVWRSGHPEHMESAFYADSRIRGWRENWVYRLPDGLVVTVYEDVTERKRAEQALRENEERLSLVLEATNDGFWDYDIANGKLIYSERYAQLLGYYAGELPARLENWLELVHPEDRPDTEQRFEAHLRGESDQFRSEHRMRTKSGRYRWLLVRGKVVERNAEGRPLRITGTHTDITERKEVEQQLRLWSLVFSASSEGIFITDAERRIVTVNRAFCEMSGYGSAELVGHDPRMLKSGHHDPAFYQALWTSLHETGRWQGELWDRRKGGDPFPMWATLNELRNERGEVTNYIGIFTDISERKAVEERIQHLSTHDFLTGLPNRRLLIDLLEEAMAHAERSGKKAAVLFIDLDRFKDINDSYGHQAGDRLVQQLADRLRSVVQGADTVSRVGGDDFVIVLADTETADQAAMVAQRLIRAVVAPFALQGTEIAVTPSVGIALYPDDGATAESLLVNAEAAMYHSKLQGPASFQFFVPELGRRALERIRLQNDLHRAIHQGEFLLHFQPQVDAGSGSVHGVEALVRWQRDGELVPPDEFIPVAEETGLIVPLGDWVLQEALRQQRLWRDQGLPPLMMAVNIAASQFHGPGFRRLLEDLLSATGADPLCLEIELTERILMTDAEKNIRLLRELKEVGVALSVDDFGTGYSSLSYLRRFPIDRLKVDQSFVKDMTTDAADRTITEAIIALGRSLGLQVIAEGVESEEEAEMLRISGCHIFQGFHFGMPMPADAFAATYGR